MPTQKTDRLNNLQSRQKTRSIPINKYFGEMKLPEYSKERRIDFANMMLEVMVSMLTLMSAETKIDEQYYIGYFERRYSDCISQADVDIDKYPMLKDYENEIVPMIISSTNRNKDDPYFWSKDRATKISEEESSTVFNIVDYCDAKDAGKTSKTWSTELDDRVRGSHREAEGQTVPIDEYFTIGSCQMLFPRDMINGTPEEVDGCRCTVTYS